MSRTTHISVVSAGLLGVRLPRRMCLVVVVLVGAVSPVSSRFVASGLQIRLQISRGRRAVCGPGRRSAAPGPGLRPATHPPGPISTREGPGCVAVPFRTGHVPAPGELLTQEAGADGPPAGGRCRCNWRPACSAVPARRRSSRQSRAPEHEWWGRLGGQGHGPSPGGDRTR